MVWEMRENTRHYRDNVHTLWERRFVSYLLEKFQAQDPAYESAGRSGRRGEDLGGPGRGVRCGDFANNRFFSLTIFPKKLSNGIFKGFFLLKKLTIFYKVFTYIY